MKKSQLESLTNEREAYRRATDSRFYGAILCIVGGATTAIYGFRLWYVRVQKPLDEKLAVELATAKLKVEKKRSEG